MMCSGQEIPPRPSHAYSPEGTKRTRVDGRTHPAAWCPIHASQIGRNLRLKPARMNIAHQNGMEKPAFTWYAGPSVTPEQPLQSILCAVILE